MDYLISKCCNAFTVNKGKFIECSNCNEIVGELDDDNDIVIGVNYNQNPDIIATISDNGNFLRTAKRLAKDETCMLVDNKLCKKCGSKCRLLRDPTNSIIYVCSNCREILDEN